MKSYLYQNPSRATWAEDYSFLNNDINKEEGLGLKKSYLKVSDLNLYINKAHILKNVNLEIPDKKITCIIGPSGCGKSTLLKTFNRLIDDTEGVRYEGSIWVDDTDIFDKKTEITDIRKKMGLLSQRPCPLPMSIYDNIAFGCKMHGERNRKKLNQIVEEQLKAVGLWAEVKDRLHAPASKLSIGQQQRLCLARGLAVEPEFILADEATSALDPISSKNIEELFIELKKDYSIILVTHTLRQALRIADHVIFMYLGEVIEAGPADEIFNNPKQELTRKYLEGAFS
ncbi:MAG TPA: phosphate ABC transporter ATP-binding protein [Paludibacter sp.]|nr:phosphate ABC transporter ATP-binding protein [Paludibacter sp.]